jgi:hypothetical protein
MFDRFDEDAMRAFVPVALDRPGMGLHDMRKMLKDEPDESARNRVTASTNGYHPAMRASTTGVRTCAALSVMLVLSASGIGAECLQRSPPCEELKSAQLVFYGEVLGVEGPDTGVPQRIRFRISRVIKGVKTGAWSGAFAFGPEDYRFRPGERVVVYASLRADEWSTACTRTRAFAPGDKALLESEIAQLKVCYAIRSCSLDVHD